MARPGLTRHRKFLRLSRRIGGIALALGSLELVWAAAYEAGDEVLGDADDIEQLAAWQGTPGHLATALVECGFLDETARGLAVHDLWDHAPDYVRKRRLRERQRKDNGQRLSGQCPVSDQSEDGHRQPNGRTPAPAPAPAPAPVLPTTPPDTQNEKKPARSRSQKAASTSAPPVSPVVLTLPCTSGVEHPVTEADVREWTAAYPGIDVTRELRRAIQWVKDNPTRRKTPKGARSYLGRWLARAQDRASGPSLDPRDNVNTVRIDPPTRYVTRRQQAEAELEWARRERSHWPGVVERHEANLRRLIESGRADETIPAN